MMVLSGGKTFYFISRAVFDQIFRQCCVCEKGCLLQLHVYLSTESRQSALVMDLFFFLLEKVCIQVTVYD